MLPERPGLGLTVEAVEELWGGCELGAQDLDRYVAFELEVVSVTDLRHAEQKLRIGLGRMVDRHADALASIDALLCGTGLRAQAGDEELVQFFREAQDWQRHLATQAKAVLKQRLSAGDGRHWNQEAKIWNLTLMA